MGRRITPRALVAKSLLIALIYAERRTRLARRRPGPTRRRSGPPRLPRLAAARQLLPVGLLIPRLQVRFLHGPLEKAPYRGAFGVSDRCREAGLLALSPAFESGTGYGRGRETGGRPDHRVFGAATSLDRTATRQLRPPSAASRWPRIDRSSSAVDRAFPSRLIGVRGDPGPGPPQII